MINTQILHYKILKELGRGGMGVVYLAEDTRLKRQVAIKFLPDHLLRDHETCHRFKIEAQAAASLNHPNIAQVYAIEESDEHQFIVMEYVEGRELKSTIDTPLSPPLTRGETGGSHPPLDTCLNHVIQIADGLQAAHEKGVIHRDIKPANIIITAKDKVKIMDFGLAKISTDSNLTNAGTILGTPAYMPPEQINGSDVDCRADIWSLGVILYELLTGGLPFQAQYPQVALYSILNEEPKPIHAFRPELPDALHPIVTKLLRKELVERYQTMEAVHRDLLEVVNHLTSASGQATAPGYAPPVAQSTPAESSPGSDRDSWLFSGVKSIHFVGRTEECDILRKHIERAMRHERQVVFITGESGVGKTTLLNSFLKKACAHWSVVIGYGQCLEQVGAGEAYMPVLEALGRICRSPRGVEIIDLLARQAPTWLAQMPALVKPEEVAAINERTLGANKERMLREMVETIEAICVMTPLVLVLEDIHWSDYSTLDLISWLARRQEPARFLLICTYRSDDVKMRDNPLQRAARELKSRGLVHELNVPFLSESAVAEYLNGKFSGASFLDELTELVHKRTDGNPLFIENLTNDWLAQKKVKQVDSTWRLESTAVELVEDIPESIQQLLEQNIERLDENEQEILRIASVAGAEFPTAAVAAAADLPEDEIESRCSALAKRRLFLKERGSAEWPDGTISSRFVFVHALHHDVLYRTIPAGKLAQLHRKIGLRLEAAFGDGATSHPAELARHFIMGRDDQRAVKFLQLAARLALHRSAHQEALTHITTALDLLKKLPPSAECALSEIKLKMMLGTALVALEGWANAEIEEILTQARHSCEQLPDKKPLIPVMLALGSLYEVRGQYDKSQSIISEQIRISQSIQDVDLLLEAHDLMACSLFHQGFYPRSVEHAEEGLQRFDTQKHSLAMAPGGENPGVNCIDWIALSQWFLGFPDQALARVYEALKIARQPGNLYSLASAQILTAFLHQFRREDRQTLELAEAATVIAEKQGFPYRIAQCQILIGWVLAMQNEAEEGIAQILCGLEGCFRVGARLDEPYFKALLAEAYLSANRISEGLETIESALQLVHKSRTFFYEPELHRLRGDLTLKANSDEAEKHYRSAIAAAIAQKSLSLELRATTSLARLHFARNHKNNARAKAALETVHKRFTEGFQTRDLSEARLLLDQLS